MPPNLSRRILRLVAVLMATLGPMGPLLAADDSTAELRARFKEAYQAVTHGRPQAARALWSGLDGYVLLPYLEYEDLWRNLSRRSDQELLGFLDREGDTLLAHRLRTLWLRRLAQQGDWETFIDVYEPQDAESLRCHYLSARAKVQPDTAPLEDIAAMWLTGDSVDATCDPAFELLYRSPLMTDSLIWARIRLAIAADRPRLAAYLARKLEDEALADLFSKWLALRADPAQFTANTNLGARPEAGDVMVDLVARRGKRDLSGTLKLWPQIKSSPLLTPAQTAEISRTLALTADRADHPAAMHLLAAVDREAVDERLEQARIARAVKTRAWSQLLAFTEEPPTDPDNQLRWRYWHARALEASGGVERAAGEYAALSKERDYYGFIAADRIDAPYRFNHLPVAPGDEELEALRKRPGVARCLELFAIDLNLEAQREWWFEAKRLSPRELEVLAHQLNGMEQHHRAIVTMGRARSYDDLDIRFPLIFRDHVELYAQRRGLEAATIFGVIRTESAFLADARSGAGARGLMQLMPKTASETARRISLRYTGPAQLTDPNINIMLGSAYLKDMLRRFDGNLALAAAAYNAGPHRARAWRPSSGCVPLDIWVEQVPFAETRSYVRRLLFHTVVYQERMGRSPLRVSSLAGGITAEKGSSATC